MSLTQFQSAVFKAVQKISSGETRTYKEIAKAIGKPKAYRAVGNALHKNFDPTIPCHRVIKSDGSLGGYNRGRERKSGLLQAEYKKIKISN